ncbi:hypothetical protein A5875_000189, partial [Enterococcus sp. 3H8_DIV0648]
LIFIFYKNNGYIITCKKRKTRKLVTNKDLYSRNS